MIKLAHRVGLPFLRADAAFIKVFSYEQKILSGSGTAAPHPCRLAGSDDEFHLLPVRHAGGGLRGAHHGVHGPLRRAGHPQDRPVPVPAGHRVGLHRRRPKFGILPFILSSVYGTLGATLIGVPIGLLTAVFLSKAAGPKVRTVVVTAIELLSGIPSVVFGLLGMQVLVPAVAKTFGKASGACLLSAIVVLSIMILPSIVSVSVTALNAVPPEYEQGSLALGATDTETWFKISVPAAKSGIAAGIVLGIGRAIGEAMAVMMVAGNSPNMPDSLFRSVTFLTTAIAKEMSYASGLQKQALFSIALVLFVFIMGINILLNVVLKGGKRDE